MEHFFAHYATLPNNSLNEPAAPIKLVSLSAFQRYCHYAISSPWNGLFPVAQILSVKIYLSNSNTTSSSNIY